MPIAEYKGPAQNAFGVFKHLLGEKIERAFLTGDGYIMLYFPSGHALRFQGWTTTGNVVLEVLDPIAARGVMQQRQQELRSKMQELRDLVPGVDL